MRRQIPLKTGVQILAGLLAGLMTSAGPALAAKRVAFVVGVNTYDNLSPTQQLKTAVNDVRALSKALTGLGFEVVKVEDARRSEFNRGWQGFLNRLAPDDTVAVFFSGHGVELNGLNYLLPRDVPAIRTGEEELLRREALGVADLIADLRDRHPMMSLIVLDACRDNPFKRAGTRSVGGNGGLAAVQPPEGTFVMFSAGAGEMALDRLSDADPVPTSVYMRHLLPLLAKSGLALPDIAQQVRRDVHMTAGAAGHKQTPAYYDEVIGRFCLAGCEAQITMGPKLDDEGQPRPQPKPDVAVAASARAIAMDPQDAEAFYTRANALRTKKDYDAAIADYTATLRIDFAHIRALVGRGMSYREKGEVDRAIADFTEAARLDPTKAVIYNHRGLTKYLKDDVDGAIADFGEAIRVDPKYAYGHYNRGRLLYLRKRRHDSAITNLTEAIRLNPKYTSAFNYRGLAYAAKGDQDRAIADYDAALRIEPGYKYALANKAVIQRRKGDYDGAIANYDAAIRSDPAYALAWSGRATVHHEKKDYGRAIADFGEFIRLEPGNAYGYNSRAWNYFKNNEAAKGLPDVEKAIDIAPNLAIAFDTRAHINEVLGKTDAAIADFKRALALDPRIEASQAGLKRLVVAP